jgi:hypothetical protein
LTSGLVSIRLGSTRRRLRCICAWALAKATRRRTSDLSARWEVRDLLPATMYGARAPPLLAQQVWRWRGANPVVEDLVWGSWRSFSNGTGVPLLPRIARGAVQINMVRLIRINPARRMDLGRRRVFMWQILSAGGWGDAIQAQERQWRIPPRRHTRLSAILTTALCVFFQRQGLRGARLHLLRRCVLKPCTRPSQARQRQWRIARWPQHALRVLS